ncbi:MAG: 50S ribosomal protein L3, partial [Chloroflexi bacterium]|nr:50S ribosomal protein L3 [Chloroflexota bacterium]
RVFTEAGEIVPVTIIQAGPCFVTQIKTAKKDGYSAIQIGYEHAKRLTKPEAGHLHDVPPLRHLREIRTDDLDAYRRGQVLDVGLFAVGDRVDVIGISKGKGFAGAVKRHKFAGGPKTHGQSDRHRAVGSIGSTTTPGRVFKGMRGPGHMGDRRVTVLNLEVVQVDPERHLLAVKGSIPGARSGLVMVRGAVKA